MEWNSLSGKFEDIKGVARRCKAKNRQCNGQQKKRQRIYNYLQKTKDGATQIPLSTRGELNSNECDSIAHNV
jgi:hypothetical protein